MKKKIYISIIAVLMGILLLTGAAYAVESEVSDREMAIAAAMSYVPLQKNKTMAQCFDIAGNKTISSIVNFVNSKFNLHDYATIEEINDWIVDDYNGGLKVVTQNGLTLFRLKRGNDIMIVIRGSNSPTDAFEDIRYGVTNYTKQEKHLKKYIINTINEYSGKKGNYRFYITGHSLGGYLASIAGATMEQEITKNPEKYKNISLDRIVSFNGMGINFLTYFGNKYNYGDKAEIIETLKKMGKEGRLIEYYAYGDLVSALGVHYGELRKLTPSIDSITYHRAAYSFLGSFGKKLISIAEDKDVFNAFKTDLKGVQNYYKVNNIAAFINLTHEADVFVTIDLNKSKNTPKVKIIENKTVLSSHISKGTDTILATKNVTLKALTSYANAKKYEWYVSDNKRDWKLIKTVDLYNLNGQAPTNTLDINIKDIAEGKSKYYKVVSYFDDNYVSSRYNFNTETNEYEYVETNESRRESYEPISAIVQVNHKKTAKSKIKSIIKSIFRR